MNYPAQGVQEAKHRKVFTKSRCPQKRIATKENKLQVDTHTQKRMFPPIMKAKAKDFLLRFQP